MLKNIMDAPTSTVVGLAICFTVIICIAMVTHHESFVVDLLKLGGAAAGGATAAVGAVWPGKNDDKTGA